MQAPRSRACIFFSKERVDMKHSMVLAASLAAACFGLMTPVQAADATYTADQAKRGEEIYNDWGRCYTCHLRSLEADPQQKAAPLIGVGFMRKWSAQPVSELHYKIRYTMPAAYRGQGTLRESEVSDLIAFLLQRNGVPPGDKELPKTEAELKALMIKK
jgi:mono/diheme cytochrome c family protein